MFPVLGKPNTLAAKCFLWRTCLGKEVNVGREWVGEESECLSRKTEIDRKAHLFLRSGDDVAFGQVGGAFYIVSPTGLKGQQVWNRAVCFNVMSQPGLPMEWKLYMLSSLFQLHCDLALLCRALQKRAHDLPFGSIFRA